MNDLTLCTSENCPMKNSCYRVKAEPNKHQSWMNFEYTCHEDSGFYDYIPILEEN